MILPILWNYHEIPVSRKWPIWGSHLPFRPPSASLLTLCQNYRTIRSRRGETLRALRLSFLNNKIVFPLVLELILPSKSIFLEKFTVIRITFSILPFNSEIPLLPEQLRLPWESCFYIPPIFSTLTFYQFNFRKRFMIKFFDVNGLSLESLVWVSFWVNGFQTIPKF